MPALTISAVSSGADTLTVTAHGQVTGAGPARVFVQPGGAMPGGLAAITDYWVIVVDANTVKLATSSANALLGTAIDITSNGTLPLQLLLGIPYCRATTYAAGSQIKSLDLDALQDTWIALWNYLSGQGSGIFGNLGAREMNFHASAYHTDTLAGLSAGAIAVNDLGYITGFGGAGFVLCPVPLNVGQVLLTATQYYAPNGTGSSIQPTLKYIDHATGTVTPVWTGSSDNVGAAGVIKSQTSSTLNHTILSGKGYFFEVAVTNAAHRVHGGTITYRP